MGSTKTPGRVIRATVVRSAQAVVSRVIVRAEVDSGLAKAQALARSAMVAIDDGWVDVKRPPVGASFVSISHGIAVVLLPPVARFLLEDMVVVLEVFVVDFDKQLADDAVPVDFATFTSDKGVTDNVAIVDGVAIAFDKILVDSVAPTDSIVTLLTKGLALADSVVPIDNVILVLGGKPELNEQELNVGELN